LRASGEDGVFGLIAMENSRRWNDAAVYRAFGPNCPL
jgi:hypothetical protein